MLKKSIAVVFAIALAMTATVAIAQTNCSIGAYGDAGGTQNIASPVEGQTFSVFVVLFTEDTAAAAAYSIDIPGLGTEVFTQSISYGPSGLGLHIPEAGGVSVAFGECAIGFTGLPVVVAEYELFALAEYAGGVITVSENTTQGPVPLYVTCNDIIRTCAEGPSLVVEPVIPTEASSFSSIKSLYN
jgi:hypothetical protein